MHSSSSCRLFSILSDLKLRLYLCQREPSNQSPRNRPHNLRIVRMRHARTLLQRRRRRRCPARRSRRRRRCRRRICHVGPRGRGLRSGAGSCSRRPRRVDRGVDRRVIAGVVVGSGGAEGERVGRVEDGDCVGHCGRTAC
ncbi:hypothetical protein BU26DRAFT_255580 [Trematosphaeria pertusa]|uniref:Uncharacterized protein n=1 Tax=Trematosphaeria pertusa TaxID=390896 RepID=A0A6A6IPD1_9PLEO|nr:uncharacterized protein BU26DRAFT_255580 [Trematosphaeria pertusa]KAF2252331.1 hypothetical protein BU26DRAFT_255580 [Trematosphaeria pertusa]